MGENLVTTKIYPLNSVQKNFFNINMYKIYLYILFILLYKFILNLYYISIKYYINILHKIHISLAQGTGILCHFYTLIKVFKQCECTLHNNNF